ncbi:MAG: ATP-binding protein [Bacteroidetes bacterium]|nr:MAG: ATP-binding protein [Bacteroidota bacterium]PIE88304.1 MAG: ATP-binding protein [Bacteroidota bacterium]
MKEICEHIVDIVNNSIRAEADHVVIAIEEQPQHNTMTLTITDNGTGMDQETLNRISDPFFTTKKGKKTGMGTSLLKYHAELTGGTFSIVSTLSKGTRVSATFGLNHIDRQPLGDIIGTLLLFLTGHPEVHLIYTHSTPNGSFTLDSKELTEALGVPLNSNGVRPILKEFIKNNLTALQILA